MEGKVKYVRRSVWYQENTQDHWKSNVHPVRCTCTFAVLYNGDKVDIDEDDIRDYYNRKKINDELIEELSNELHNVWINYFEEYGDYCLDGVLSDYI